MHHREAFQSELTVQVLKESFEGSLEALPEPLLVKTRGQTAYCNSAYKNQLATENFGESVEALLKENIDADALEEEAVPKKVTRG